MAKMKHLNTNGRASSPLLRRERNPSEAKTLRSPACLRTGYSRRGIKKQKVLVGGPARNAKRIVLAGGCFDIIHYGHIHFLSEAKKLGDWLIVALESDKNIRKLKGSARPIHSQRQRKQMLESLSFVDEVLLLPNKNMADSDYLGLVLEVRPLIIAVTGGDPIKAKKEAHARAVGAKVVEIPKIRVSSTSQIARLLDLE